MNENTPFNLSGKHENLEEKVEIKTGMRVKGKEGGRLYIAQASLSGEVLSVDLENETAVVAVEIFGSVGTGTEVPFSDIEIISSETEVDPVEPVITPSDLKPFELPVEEAPDEKLSVEEISDEEIREREERLLENLGIVDKKAEVDPVEKTITPPKPEPAELSDEEKRESEEFKQRRAAADKRRRTEMYQKNMESFERAKKEDEERKKKVEESGLTEREYWLREQEEEKKKWEEK